MTDDSTLHLLLFCIHHFSSDFSNILWHVIPHSHPSVNYTAKFKRRNERKWRLGWGVCQLQTSHGRGHRHHPITLLSVWNHHRPQIQTKPQPKLQSKPDPNTNSESPTHPTSRTLRWQEVQFMWTWVYPLSCVIRWILPPLTAHGKHIHCFCMPSKLG